MESLWHVGPLAGGAILAYVTLIWLQSLRLRDSGIMDVAWGPGFVIATLAAIVASGSLDALTARPARVVLVLAMVAIWAARLSLHIGFRNHGQPEDYRYAAWRREAGNAWWWRSYFKVFLLQGLVMWIVATPLLLATTASAPESLQALDILGVALWLFGFLFEAVADEQLRRFKSDPANSGHVMQSGLWRFSRHPNYFGESVLWWGFWIVACAVPFGWATVVSPVLMTWLLLRVSGVAMLERGLTNTKPGYDAYRRRTNAFFPGPPRTR